MLTSATSAVVQRTNKVITASTIATSAARGSSRTIARSSSRRIAPASALGPAASGKNRRAERSTVTIAVRITPNDTSEALVTDR